MELKLIPLVRNTKVPPKGTSWKESMSDDWRQIEDWERQGLNLGLPLQENNRSVIDFDDKIQARVFFQANRNICTFIVETRRGAHFHFSGSTQTRKFEHGDIKGNGYVLWPFSIINLGTPDVWTYRFAAKGPLQPFPEHLFPIPEKETNTQPIEECDTLRRITRARLWLATVEPAVSGQGGHNVMFRACCKMFQMFNLSPTEAYPLILEFNERAEPKFSERELIHKLNSAEKANGKSTVSK